MDEAIRSATIIAAVALGHAHERLIYGLGSYERAKRRKSAGETDHDKTDHCR